MDFDRPEAWQKKLGDYQTTDVPAELSWAERSPGILAALRRRRRRRAIMVWLVMSATMILAGTWYWYWSTPPLGAFPIPLAGATPTASLKASNHAARVTGPSHQQGAKIPAGQVASTGPMIPMSPTSPAAPGVEQEWPVATGMQADGETPGGDWLIDSALAALPTRLEPLAVLPADYPQLLWPAPVLTTLPLAPSRPQPRWSILAWGGPGHHVANFDSGKPLAQTTPLWGWQSGVWVIRQLNPSWQLRAGVQVVTQRQKVQYQATTPVKLYRPNSVDTIFVNAWNGQETIVYRDSVPGRRTRNFQHYNQLQWLQLPLALSFERQWGRWQSAIQAGGALQVLVQSQGRVLDQTGAVVDLTAGTWYRRQPLLHWQIGWHNQWRLNPRWGLGALVMMDQSGQQQLTALAGYEQRSTNFFSGVTIQWYPQ